MNIAETAGRPEPPKPALPGRYIRGPLGWAGVACLICGLFGVVAAGISLIGWLLSIVLMIGGPIMIFLDLNGQIDQARSELGGGLQRRMIEYLVLASVLLLAGALLMRLDMAPPPRDLLPGAVVDEGPDRVNPGCPIRTWTIGDYVPEACLDRHSYSRLAYHLGVESLWTGRRSLEIHKRLWVRLGRDLAGGPCAPHAGCRVMTLVKDRFSRGAPELGHETGRDFQQEPRAYIVASAASLVLREWPLLVFGLVLIEGRNLRGTPPDRKSARP